MDNDFRPVRRPAKPANTDTPRQRTPVFRTPEEVAGAEEAPQPEPAAVQPPDDADIIIDENAEPEPASSEPPGPDKPEKRRGWRQKLRNFELHWPPGKKEAAVAAVLLILIAAAVVVAIEHSPKAGAPAPPKPVAKAPKVTTVPSTLTGLPVDPSVNRRPVTAVMIENSPDARPQSGLGQAGVVFEALAEGGVTRFMALYQDTAPDNVGPIRSARPYFIQWALGFDAGYAHVGGSPDALQDIKAWGVRDLDQFYNGSYYHRVSSRVAPHNVYTSLAELNKLEAAKGYTTSTYTGFVRKKEAPAKQPTAASINFTLSGATYNVHYAYDAAHNDYLRSEGGAAQIDANTNTQISPKVVIALIIPYSLGSLDATGAYYSDYATIGSGSAYVFQDGTVTTGQWSKSSATAQFTFTDSSGQTLKLNPGQTWLTALGSSTDVSYTAQ